MKAIPSTPNTRRQQGVVLPIALIMLVIISFAGLLAARNSATHEQFSNNMRTNQVSRQLAEEALRYCEQIAIDNVEGGTAYGTAGNNIQKSAITSEAVTEIKKGVWNTKANWVDNTKFIEVTPTYSNDVGTDAKTKLKKPKCIIETMSNDRFLVTARGFSADAVTDSTTGALTSGSEVWLQSILTPRVPNMTADGFKSDDEGG
jgi:type IV pilus assembly protein PilX